MFLDKDKFKNYHCSQYKSDDEKNEGIKTISLSELKERIDHLIESAELNNKNINEVPVFIKSNENFYCIESTGYSMGSLGMVCNIWIEVDGKYSQQIKYVAPDKRPKDGEYWKSRGVGYDLSGFVKSKLAGERLLRMVKLVLETDEPKSWLDYREHEPSWIQFKFQKEEFDLDKLNTLAKENNNIITIDILKQCVNESYKPI